MIAAFHITTTKKYTVDCPYSLQQDLETYRVFYRQTYGAEVSESDLIREIVRAYLAQDEDFRSFRAGLSRRSRNRAATVPPSRPAKNHLSGADAPPHVEPETASPAR